VALMITGMTKHFMFHIHWISILKRLYFNFFSDAFCIKFLSDGIATSISKQILSLLLLLLLCFVCFLMLTRTVVFVFVCNWPYLAVVKHVNKLIELNYYVMHTTIIIINIIPVIWE
jgi:hypothetical protein